MIKAYRGQIAHGVRHSLLVRGGLAPLGGMKVGFLRAYAK
jgi:hypothetical protein